MNYDKLFGEGGGRRMQHRPGIYGEKRVTKGWEEVHKCPTLRDVIGGTAP